MHCRHSLWEHNALVRGELNGNHNALDKIFTFNLHLTSVKL